MIRLYLIVVGILMSCVSLSAATADLNIDRLRVLGVIEDENIVFHIDCAVTAEKDQQSFTIINGNVVFDSSSVLPKGCRLEFDPSQRSYRVRVEKRGSYEMTLSFAAKPEILHDQLLHAVPVSTQLSTQLSTQGSTAPSVPWNQCSFHVPAATQRELELRSDRKDIELEFPGALRLERSEKDGSAVFTALLGPGHPFTVRWKDQVSNLNGKLVVASQSNIIVRAQAGIWNVDSVHRFEVSQGSMDACALWVPKGMQVISVQGLNIRDWDIREVGDHQVLEVKLNRKQGHDYLLHVQAEHSMSSVKPAAGMESPANMQSLGKIQGIPRIYPLQMMHNRGHILIGSDVAVQLSPEQSHGVKQIDLSSFPRLQAQGTRTMPRKALYAYEYSSDLWHLDLVVQDIVAIFDVEHRIQVSMHDDDIIVDVDFELDIRDAGIREIRMHVPTGFTLAEISGQHVDVDASHVQGQILHVLFPEAIIGRSAIHCRFEYGESPIVQKVESAADAKENESIQLSGLYVEGARNQRGFIVLGAEDGVHVRSTAQHKLRQVHIGSLPIRIDRAQRAWRFRSTDWSLSVRAEKRSAGIRAEAFHLLSMGDGSAFGSVIVTYFITGAPVDELHFRVDPSVMQTIKQLEFIGTDISSWEVHENNYTVKLNRKVIGDYNIGIYWRQRYAEGARVHVGIIQCSEVDVETGYMVLASRDNLSLALASAIVPASPNAAATTSTASTIHMPDSVLEIDRDELPASYRLPINAPILKTYKYLQGEHGLTLAVQSLEQGALIPVVIEVMELDTTISLREDTGDAESLTTVIYKVKNASSQFLSIMMPEQARIWSIHTLEKGKERSVTAAQDGSIIKIPLQRRRDPNIPMTIKLVYGLSHGTLAWNGALALQAPRSALHSTFSRWHVRVPDGLMLSTLGSSTVGSSNMEVVTENLDSSDPREQATAPVMKRIFDGWQHTVQSFVYGAGPAWWAPLLAIAIFLCYLYKRHWIPGLILVSVCTLAMYLGVCSSERVGPSAMTTAQVVIFDQALSLDSDQPMHISVAVQNHWQFGLSLSTAIISLSSAVVVLLLWWYIHGGVSARTQTVISICALATVGICVCIAIIAVPVLHPGLIHLCTWGLPLMTILWLSRGRIAHMCNLRTSINTVAMIFLGCLMFSCSSGHRAASSSSHGLGVIPMITVEAELGADSLAVDMQFTIEAEKGYVLALLPVTAVVRNADALPKNVELQLTENSYDLHFDHSGQYTISLSYLLPVKHKNAHGSCALAMPMALSNMVSLKMTETAMHIDAASAIHVTKEQGKDHVLILAKFAPGKPALFTWQPRNRNTSDEKIRMYAEILNIARCDNGLIEGVHAIQLRIAQGEVRDVQLRIPSTMTVTSVVGEDIGAWRYNAETHICEIKLSKAHSGDYALRLETQMSALSLPYEVEIGGIIVAEAERNRSLLGISNDASVIMSMSAENGSQMHVDDFTIQAAGLVREHEKIRYAFRLRDRSTAVAEEGAAAEESAVVGAENTAVVKFKVQEVQPEIRSSENASFTISDERLVYSGHVQAQVSKSGIFTLDIAVPSDFDIDSLSCAQMSHWDDETAQDTMKNHEHSKQRIVRVYLKNKTTGLLKIALSLSQPLNGIPKTLQVPSLAIVGSLKHKGIMVLSAERGLQLQIIAKSGVSEIEKQAQQQRRNKALNFRILQKNWSIEIKPKVIRAISNVRFLHDIHVAEGMLRHDWYLRHQMRNAGRKQFKIVIPDDAMGVVINAPDLARWDDLRVDGTRMIVVTLTKKYYEQTWPLHLSFETRYDRSKGEIVLQGLAVAESDSVKGHVVIHGSDHVEVQVHKTRGDMVSTEARAIPQIFGAGSLADAAFCFKSGNGLYTIPLTATRHSSADVLQAQVLNVDIDTVFTGRGESFNRMRMMLRVGKKRYLHARLPKGSRIWSLRVDGVVRSPSKLQRADADATDDGDEDTWLIPVARGVSGDLPLQIDLTYVCIQEAAWENGAHRLEGPQFDLPLVDIDWNIYLPQSWDYNEMRGTLSVREGSLGHRERRVFGLESYEQQNDTVNKSDLDRARMLQEKGKKLAQQGKQYEAKQALNMAYNFSFSDANMNEDARVQLHVLNNLQSVVGFVGRRGNLRQQPGEWEDNRNKDLGDTYRHDDAMRVHNSLSKDDSKNLEKIVNNMIRMQEDAANVAPRMMITAPLHGRLIRMHRNLQVKAHAPMYVTFRAEKQQQPQSADQGQTSLASISLWAICVACALSVLFFIESRWQQVCNYCTIPEPEPTVEDLEHTAVSQDVDVKVPETSELIADDEWQALIDDGHEGEDVIEPNK